ncbi:MAG: SMC family ATPase, partial [Anaerolineae bacterium]|nr:SMC family ATPase [Anaerolineae bacterium]
AATKKTLTTEGKEMNERIATLEQTEGASCPLCGQALTDEHREQVLADLTEERDRKREIYREATERIKDIDEESKAHEGSIQTIGEELAELPRLRSKAGALQQRAEAASEARTRMAEAQAALNSIEETLQNENFAQEVRAQLATVEAERAAIGYDPDAHKAAQSQLQQYSQYERRHIQLEVAQENLPREQSALENARARQERLTTALADEGKAADDLRKEIERLSLLEKEYERREAELNELRIQARDADGKVGEAKQQLNSLQYQRERKQTILMQKEQTLQQRELYEQLRQAFGKNGVPLMLIESAIPELEQASNELLARMTDGRMHLRFSTQRAKASGSGVIETLDIEIADELGTRAYEMYSGGEAFRINFAVRVALSKLLARRAGAQLRTLFIDEGFGTQDDDGRNKLVEAITAIQQDFDMVLVITHIDE